MVDVSKVASRTFQWNIKETLDWLFHLVSYALILLLLSLVFKKTIYIDPEHYWIWGMVVSFIIYVLHPRIKPLLVWLTLPITGVTVGLFYPFINVFILKLVELITFRHFAIKGIFMPFIVAICISCINFLVSEMVLKPLFRTKQERSNNL